MQESISVGREDRTHALNTAVCDKYTVFCTLRDHNTNLGFSKVAQSEVKSPQVVEDLRGNISLHLLLQDAGGCSVCRQRSLNVSLLQDLSQLDPRLHIIWVLLRHLLQMTLGNNNKLSFYIRLQTCF